MVGWEAGALGSSSASALGVSPVRHLPLLISGPQFPHLQNRRGRDQLFPRPSLTGRGTGLHLPLPPTALQILGQPSPARPPCPAFPPSREPRPMKSSSVRRWAGPPAWNRTGSCCPEAPSPRGQASSVPPIFSPQTQDHTQVVCVWGRRGLIYSLPKAASLRLPTQGSRAHDQATGRLEEGVEGAGPLSSQACSEWD